MDYANTVDQLPETTYLTQQDKITWPASEPLQHGEIETLLTDWKGEDDEVLVQEIVLYDKNADNVITKIVQAAEKASSQTRKVYDENNVSEIEQAEIDVPDEEFSTLLATMGVDLDEFITRLREVTEEEECQAMEEATSKVFSGQSTDEDSNFNSTVLSKSSCFDFEDTQKVKECADRVHTRDNYEQDTQHVKEISAITHRKVRLDQASAQNQSFSNYIRSVLKLMYKFDKVVIEVTERGIHSLCPKPDIAGLCTMRKRNANIRLISALIVKETKTIYILYVLQNAIHQLRGIVPFLVVLTTLVNFQRHYSANLK